MTQQQSNLLPYNGEVYYFGTLLRVSEADTYLNVLLTNIDWRNDEAMMFGKKLITRRKVAWYGNEGLQYTYSKVTKNALPWTPELLSLKHLAEAATHETYNSCLLNLYHNGTEGMAWHSDGEKDLKKNGAIASLSFGADRRFCFRHKQTKETVCIALQHGSLLLMKGETQQHWLHRLPPTTKVYLPRVNLTFRTIDG